VHLEVEEDVGEDVVAFIATAGKVVSLVFKGPVYRTGKKTETGLNWTD
jgi:hypothetical protein